MTGAIAGSAILYAPNSSNSLHTVTMTINNSCNLHCPHCYLQYGSNQFQISEQILEKVYDSNFKHLAIVGKEPTLCPKLLEKIVLEMKKAGRTVSIITNGVQLNKLSTITLKGLSYIDVSFDGGAKTYFENRKSDYQKIISNIKYAKINGCKHFNALHTLYAENLQNIDDMVMVSKDIEFDYILFSPYQESQNDGENSVTFVSLIDKILPKLAKSKIFQTQLNAKLLIGKLEIKSKEFNQKLLKKISELKLEDKIIFDPVDPLLKGFIRVNYDGKVMTPLDSIHPKNYYSTSIELENKISLNQIFSFFQNKEIF